jgi:hypothetical protein
MTKNEQLNRLATSYTEGNNFALTELTEELGSLIRSQARNAANRSEEMSVFIPATEFESA